MPTSPIRKIKRLKFIFEDNYPIEAPEVTFVGKMPDHEHIYSNGFICMSILYDCKLNRVERSDECRVSCKVFGFHVGLG